MAFKARVVKDSLSIFGHRITTFELTFWRSILAEFNTHRMLSRNAASSRAIPIQKMLSRVWNEPFKPVWWGANMAGMQSKAELTGLRLYLAQFIWHIASRVECLFAWLLFKVGLHKQIANRRLECDGWVTVIVTATEWGNFFGLRTHPDAQPEFQHLAKMAKEAYDASEPELMAPGDWHLPLVDDYHLLVKEGYSMDDIVKICVGRCARVSYLTHDGKRDPRADIDLAARLHNSGHMSPFEHPACVPTAAQLNEKPWSGNFAGWLQHRKTIPGEYDFSTRNKQ